MKVGTTELVLILVVALVVFGPSKLPELGKLAGQAVGSFKKYLNTFEGDWNEEPQPAQQKQPEAAPAATDVTAESPAPVVTAESVPAATEALNS